MRIALFGGTFDPMHRGHLTIAQAAADQFALDLVLFAPAGRQPHKRSGTVATYDQRLQMVALACAGANPLRFRASTLDAPLADGSPNYTVRTLELLAAEYPHAQLFSLAGADTFENLAKWREPMRLLQLAEWIVVNRPGSSLRIPEGLTLTPAQRDRIHLLDSIHEEVAATNLRQRLAHGEDCEDLLPDAVAAYIAEHGLYPTLLQ